MERSMNGAGAICLLEVGDGEVEKGGLNADGQR